MDIQPRIAHGIIHEMCYKIVSQRLYAHRQPPLMPHVKDGKFIFELLIAILIIFKGILTN